MDGCIDAVFTDWVRYARVARASDSKMTKAQRDWIRQVFDRIADLADDGSELGLLALSDMPGHSDIGRDMAETVHETLAERAHRMARAEPRLPPSPVAPVKIFGKSDAADMT